MKRITFTLALSLLLSSPALSQTGVLDSTFGVNGRVQIQYDSPEGFAMSANRILTVGKSYIFCQHPDGSFDNSFDSDGMLHYNSYPAPVPGLVLLCVAEQKDGKIVAGGYSDYNGNSILILMRYHANGKKDSSFGLNGVVKGSANLDATSLLITDDGKIVVGTNQFFLLRYKANGDPDTGFGLNGITSRGTGCRINSLALTANDNIIASGVGYPSSGTNDKFVVVGKYDAGGQFDNSFGDSGLVLDTLNRYNTFFGLDDYSGMAIQTDGKILVTGSIYTNGDYSSFIKRYTASGRADNSFGSNGTLITDIDSQYNFGAAITVLPGGDIIQGGNVAVSKDSFSLFSFGALMLRHKPDGSIDSSFGTNGRVFTASATYTSMVVGLGLQPGNNKLISVAYDRMSGGFGTVISRYSSGVHGSGIADDFSIKPQSPLVYPNPVNDQPVLTFVLNQSDNITVRLLDMQGRQVKVFSDSEHMQAGTHTITLNMPELAEGIYFINLSGNNGQASVKVEK